MRLLRFPGAPGFAQVWTAEGGCLHVGTATLGNGKGEQKGGAVGEFAFGADGAAVGEHDVFGDGEAETGASGLAGAGFIHAIEALEQAWEMLGRDARAEVPNGEFDGVRKLAGAEHNSSAGGAGVGTVLQSIVNQVGKDLVNGFAVGENRREIFGEWVGTGKALALQMGGRGILDLQVLYLKIDTVATGDLAKALFGVVQKFHGRNGFGVETSFAGFDASQGQQIFGEAGHAVGILADDFQKLTCGNCVFGSAVEQGFSIALNRSERSAEFVGNVGDEVAAGFLDALGFGEVAKYGDSASVRQRRGGNVESAPGNYGRGAGSFDFAAGGGFLDGGEEVGVADGFDYRLLQASALRNQAVHGLISPLYEAVGAHGDDGVLHAVEQGFKLALAGLDGGETLLDAAGSLIDGAGDAANFVRRSFEDAGLKIAFGNAGSDVDDAFEAASAPVGSDRGHQKGEDECQAGGHGQPVAKLRGNGFHIGERVREADGAAGDRNRYI